MRKEIEHVDLSPDNQLILLGYPGTKPLSGKSKIRIYLIISRCWALPSGCTACANRSEAIDEKGHTSLLMVPLPFVSDHVGTLHEILWAFDRFIKLDSLTKILSGVNFTRINFILMK
jgi:hypothetical protein